MITLVVLLVLGFAAFRITRFFVIDTFFEGSRAKVQVYAANRQGRSKFFWGKFLDLISCTWCLGFWISLIVYSLYLWECPIWFDQLNWISVFAVAGVQGLLHALEPDE